MMSLRSEAKGPKVRCVTNKPNPHIPARPAPHTRMALFPCDHRPPLSSHLLLSEKPGWMEQHPLVISSLKHGHLNPCWSIKTSMSSHCGTVGKGPGIAIAVAQILFPGTSKKKRKTTMRRRYILLCLFCLPLAFHLHQLNHKLVQILEKRVCSLKVEISQQVSKQECLINYMCVQYVPHTECVP